MTIRDLAGKAGVSNQTIVQIEHGRISPRIRTIRRICEALEVSPEEVVEFGEALRGPVDEGDADDEGSTGPLDAVPDRLQPLIDTMPAGSLGGISDESTFGFVLAPDGAVRYASPSVERVLGVDAGSLVGADVFDAIIQFVHPDDQYETMRLLHYLLVTPGAVDEITYRVSPPGGDWREMRLHGTNLIDHPAIEGVLLVASPLPED